MCIVCSCVCDRERDRGVYVCERDGERSKHVCSVGDVYSTMACTIRGWREVYQSLPAACCYCCVNQAGPGISPSLPPFQSRHTGITNAIRSSFLWLLRMQSCFYSFLTFLNLI